MPPTFAVLDDFGAHFEHAGAEHPELLGGGVRQIQDTSAAAIRPAVVDAHVHTARAVAPSHAQDSAKRELPVRRGERLRAIRFPAGSGVAGQAIPVVASFTL